MVRRFCYKEKGFVYFSYKHFKTKLFVWICLDNVGAVLSSAIAVCNMYVAG